MPRSFNRRIEVAFPVEEGTLKHRLIDEITALTLRDNVKARLLQPDGTYLIPARPKGVPAHRSQIEFVALARQAGVNGGRGPRASNSRATTANLTPGRRRSLMK